MTLRAVSFNPSNSLEYTATGRDGVSRPLSPQFFDGKKVMVLVTDPSVTEASCRAFQARINFCYERVLFVGLSSSGTPQRNCDLVKQVFANLQGRVSRIDVVTATDSAAQAVLDFLNEGEPNPIQNLYLFAPNQDPREYPIDSCGEVRVLSPMGHHLKSRLPFPANFQQVHWLRSIRPRHRLARIGELVRSIMRHAPPLRGALSICSLSRRQFRILRPRHSREQLQQVEVAAVVADLVTRVVSQM